MLLTSTLLVSVGILLPIIRGFLPEFPYYDNNNVLYPLLVFYGNPLFSWLIILIYIVSFFVIALNREGFRSRILRTISVLLLVAACTVFTVGGFFRPSFRHENGTRFQGHVYHLALSYGAEPGFDYNLNYYIVYVCDGLGIVCQNIVAPVHESNITAEVPQYSTAFIVENSTELYVEIGEERYPVTQ